MTSDSINAGRGSLSVFVVTQGGVRRCIRLAHYTKTIRLSEATRAACHTVSAAQGSFRNAGARRALVSRADVQAADAKRFGNPLANRDIVVMSSVQP
jgi:hypothetical protein